MTALANGVPLTYCRVTVPFVGRVTIEARAPEDVPAPSGGILFTVADLAITATPWRSGMFAGAWSCMARGGRGGWGKTLPSRSYVSPVGVVNAQIYADAAREVGELPPVVQFPQTVGQFYSRPRGPATRVFDLITGEQAWWVDPTGVTQIGFRPPGVVAAPFDLIEADRAQGRLIVATDNPAAFAPGLTMVDPLQGSFAINAVVWTSNGSRMRGEIWT